ncbi:MAG: ribonuclease III [Anaeromyxobacteraceae bacterium]
MSEHAEPPASLAPPGAATPAALVDGLEARLGLTFSDRTRALAALTHKSYVNEHRDEEGLCDNERLEFLGDAVIDLAVSHRLMEKFPGAREGELSKMRAAVVDEQGLAEMARALDLGALLRLGRGEELTGGRRKASLLADALEAVVAAIYLEAGLRPVLGLIERFLGEAFARASAGTLDRDWKTQLQELAQSRLRATPRYRVVAEHGPDHSKVFEVETDLRGELVGRGTGRSKKDAEQAAARFALDALTLRFTPQGAAPAAVLPEAPAAAPAPPPAPPPAPAPQPPAAEAPRRDEQPVAPEGDAEPEAPPPSARKRAPRKPRTAPRAAPRKQPARTKVPAGAKRKKGR